MENKKVLLFSFAALLSTGTLTAQTGQWKLTGNSLDGGQKLGSTNNFPLDFITNNVKRISLTNKGILRMNSDQSSIQFPNPGTTPKPMMFWYESGSINNARMIMAYSPAFPNFGLKTDGFNKLDFTDGLSTTLSVDLGARNVGIGTTAPTAKLHVNSAVGEDAFRVQLNGITQLKVATGGGVAIGGGSSAPVNGLSVFGNVAVGTTNPENFKFKIIHGNSIGNGLAIENSNATGIEWELFTGAGNSPLNVIRNGAIMGQFSFPSGQYLALSDERLKTNIRSMPSVLEKIKQLKPSSYQFKKATDKQDYDGFIAQDVMKIFPTLVKHTVDNEAKIDVYTMDYSGFGVIAIKGIQELMKANEKKDSAIDALQKQIDELKTLIKGNIQHPRIDGASAESALNISSGSLEQNIPNPFTNSTAIHYSLPQKFTTAQIVITDNNGKIIKQLNISGNGKGVVNVNAALLSSGVYNYALIADGRIIGTKKMVLKK